MKKIGQIAKHLNWHPRTINTRPRTLANRAGSPSYKVIGPNEPTHFGNGRANVLHINIIHNIIQTYQIYTATELGSYHNPILSTNQRRPRKAQNPHPQEGKLAKLQHHISKSRQTNPHNKKLDTVNK